MRFQKAAQKFEPFSFHEIKVYKLDQHAEVEIIDFSNIPLHNYANGGKPVSTINTTTLYSPEESQILFDTYYFNRRSAGSK